MKCTAERETERKIFTITWSLNCQSAIAIHEYGWFSIFLKQICPNNPLGNLHE
jgi:hypothetical protein